jgi:hypothetical protein
MPGLRVIIGIVLLQLLEHVNKKLVSVLLLVSKVIIAE